MGKEVSERQKGGSKIQPKEKMEDQSAKIGGIRVLENTGVDQEEDEELFKRMIIQAILCFGC